jgi:hypothetical protein
MIEQERFVANYRAYLRLSRWGRIKWQVRAFIEWIQP